MRRVDVPCRGPDPSRFFLYLHLTARVDDLTAAKFNKPASERGATFRGLNAATAQGPGAVFLAKIQFSQTDLRSSEGQRHLPGRDWPTAIDSNGSSPRWVLQLCEVV